MLFVILSTHLLLKNNFPSRSYGIHLSLLCVLVAHSFDLPPPIACRYVTAFHNMIVYVNNRTVGFEMTRCR